MPSNRTNTAYEYKVNIANTVQQWLRDPSCGMSFARVAACSATVIKFSLPAHAFVMHSPNPRFDEMAQLPMLPMAEFLRRGIVGYDRYQRASCEVLGMWIEVDMFDATGGNDRCIM